MVRIIKEWRGIFGALAVVLICISATATATEPEEKEFLTDGYHVMLAEEDNGYFYNGCEIKPEVEKVVFVEDGTVKKELSEESYEVSYPDSALYINAGEYTVLVKSEEEAEPFEIEKKFEIKPLSMDNVSVQLKKMSYEYTGKPIKPEVEVKINDLAVQADYYDVEYLANVEPGTAKVKLIGKENLSGTKELDFEISFAKPVIKTIPSYSQMNISWKEVPGATKYVVYYQTSESGNENKLETVKAGETLLCRHKKLTSGTTYYYKVRAYFEGTDGEITSDSNLVKQRVQPYVSTITEVTRASSTSLKVKWKKISGAHGYGIYRSTTEDGEYTKVGSVKSGSTISYTDKNLTCGRTYYYKVQAYRKVGTKYIYGYASEPFERNTRPSQSKILDTTKYTSTTISLKWKKISYASGYEIASSTSKDGEYETVATISSGTKTSYEVKNIDSTTRHYYKIRAYRNIDGKKVYGSYSDTFMKRKYGWQYVNGYKLYYNGSGKLIKDVRGKIGKRDSYEIEVNKKRNCITVYAKDGDNGYTIPVVAFICSTGKPGVGRTPSGTYRTPAKYRWGTLMGPSYGQWATKITGSYLFHSVAYNRKNNRTLGVSAYNKLGVAASHGCIRLKAGDAKWIYDNCPRGTKVRIYESSTTGPLGKPGAYKLPSWHTWDPTDPTAKKYCDAKGCH